MERMWRKVNQGLTNTSTLLKQTRTNNNNRNNGSNYNFEEVDAANVRQSTSIHIDEGPVYANVTQWGYIDTSKCRKRRRKVKSRRNSSSKEKHSKAKCSEKGKSSTKETSLRERAVAKLKILNFNINWDVHMKPCGSRVNTNILTRRLCRNRSCDDNELYRSNSFKFERFRRDDSETLTMAVNTLPKQVNICDDYSLPVDFVKKRPSSLEQCRDVKFADDFPSPSIHNEQQIVINPSIKEKRPLSTASTSTVPKVLLNYCEPKDTKKSKHKRSTAKATRYLSDSSLPNSTEDENRVESKYDSSESVADSYLNNEPEYANQEKPKPIINNFTNTNTISSSPYYYSDLLSGNKTTNTQRSLKTSTIVSNTSTAPKRYRSFLDDPPSPEVISPPVQYRRRNQNQKRHSLTERDLNNRCEIFSSTTSDDSNCSECRKRREFGNLPPSQDESFGLGADYDEQDEEEEVPSPAPNEFPCNCYIQGDCSMAPHRLLGHTACICANNDENGPYRPKSIFYVHEQGEDQCADCTLDKEESCQYDSDAMSSSKRRIQVYETAFDSTVPVCPTDDNCDIEERIRNIMLMDAQFIRPNEHQVISNVNTEKSINQYSNCDYHKNSVEKRNGAHNLSSNNNLASQGRYSSHSQPSTAPMPIKFPEQHDMLYRDNIRSAPNLPQSNATQHHHRVIEVNDRRKPNKKAMSKKKCSEHASERNNKQMRKTKRRQRPSSSGVQNYSSTESLSSSSESIKSLHSSVSDGNRSSISSGSRHSASLSSHSSDSGARVRYPLRAPVIVHANMNILSPISDKSIQESSELFSGANRLNLQLFNEANGASGAMPKEFTKQTSVDMMLLDNQKSNKRRYLQNRASLLLKDEIQGSDSGISLQSRDETKIKNLVLPKFNVGQQQKQLISNQSQTSNQGFNNSDLSLPEDLANLPFDMPKLRRNLLSEQKQGNSDSATSVDLGDLPFDMPKLNRRLRTQTGQSTETATNTLDLNMKDPSSNQSMREENRFGSGRKNLSLQFNRSALLRNEGIPSDRSLQLNLFSAKNNIEIDTTIPLDRQGWYHGALSRIEAESTLRPLLEGSFLVRNCESARNDYSLSLKSAKGFMHMRIQQNEHGKFILGEFSQPFESVPEIVKHFCLNRLPVRGAEHMCLIEPVVAQLL